MAGPVHLVFLDNLEHLGVAGTAPKSIVTPPGLVPQSGDVLGFRHVTVGDGRAVMFQVQNRFFTCDTEGQITHIHISLAVMADQSFVSE